MRVQPPSRALHPFVQRLWATDPGGDGPGGAASGREHVLPTGLAHVVFRLTDEPLQVIDDRCIELRGAVLGGPRSTHYVRRTRGGSGSVGAQLLPGAARALFGCEAHELADRHLALDAVWGRDAAALRDRLAGAPSAAARIALLEAALTERLTGAGPVHPAIAVAIPSLDAGEDVARVAARVGMSQRRLVALFRQDVGLTPKRFGRVRRVQRVLPRLAAATPPSLATVAYDAGYADQAHFTHEFRAFTGLTPSQYRRLRPREPNHVPIG